MDLQSSLSQRGKQIFSDPHAYWPRAINKGTLSVMETTRAKHLGIKLRELREKAQVKPQEACERLSWSDSKLYRIEAGINVIKHADLVAALDLYGADSETRGALEELRAEARSGRRGWWVGFGDAFRSSLPALEASARGIRNYEALVIPGLVQNADYARTLMTASRPDDDPNVIDRRMRARMARQDAIFERQDAPAVHLIVDETALLRPVGGPAVMRKQLTALWEASQRPNLTLQVVPLSAGAHAGLEGPFVILNFDEASYPEVAITEGPGGDVYLEGAADLARLSLAWDRLAMAALSPEDSARMFAELANEE